jgi:hypothetical protein
MSSVKLQQVGILAQSLRIALTIPYRGTTARVKYLC